MARSPKKTAAPQTTAQRLDSIVKSARKIMRKDKGLNGDLDRLPVLTWIMFLKFLDDLERVHEDEAELAGEPFHPAIERPYRWRDWAADKAGITGPDLLSFINADEPIRPDGTKGAGLFAHLRALRGRNGGRDRRDVIATVFRGVQNRMIDGYILREVINLVDRIHFDSSNEMQTLGHLYETLLREMRDAAGDSGEFYTPRPVVRFMVERINPQIGEKVLDPACGTGGFLTESFAYMARQADSVEKQRQLQAGSLIGVEAKPLPYLLVQMNLLLHGLEAPDIDPGNALRNRLTDIGERERVEVILSNPPFGGEEEAGILSNFPDDRRTADTALLFLQLIMRKLKRQGKGRAAVVVPHGVLFGDGVAARIKADLLERFNLHTVVRLPEGVFEPYTPIASNILFFDTTGPTQRIHYWEQPAPAGRKKYSKTAPLLSADLDELTKWWSERGDDARAWMVNGPGLIDRDAEGVVRAVNLDLKNPHSKRAEDPRSPCEIVNQALESERTAAAVLSELVAEAQAPAANVQEQILEGLAQVAKAAAIHRSAGDRSQAEIDAVLRAAFSRIIAEAPRVPMGKVAPLVRRPITIDPLASYPELGVRSFGKGTFHKPALSGMEVSAKDMYQLEAGDLVVNLTFGWEGAIAVVQPDDHGRFASHRFLTFAADPSQTTANFLRYYWLTDEGMHRLNAMSPGSAGRNRVLSLKKLVAAEVPIPRIDVQRWFDRLQDNARLTRGAVTPE
jgi:type I restriction enzyme M protein